MYKIETKKDQKKLVRTLIESIILLLVVLLVITTLINVKKYIPYDKNDTSVVSGEDNGFIVVSYFGVDRQGTNTLISTNQLEEQLEALYNLGYVTITQEDVLDYYKNGTALPDKAMLLLFEDGRRDTAMFANKILEKFNFKATILSYADKFEEKDAKFLSVNDLKDLVNSGFWELGTNGYRLSYINAYDRYGRFLGEMTSDEFVTINEYLGRDYNHYLMDYIRDEDGIPTETTVQMESRITEDYHLMEEIYSEQLDEVPLLYCLMHSNTGMFGNNENVSEVNALNIKDLFAMNFNRDGYAFNNTESSIYDLTRIQPQSYWSTNHLLMRIKDDLPSNQKNNIIFESGEKANEYSSYWTLNNGAVEYKNDRLILTSPSLTEGTLTLNDISAKDLDISVNLLGNKIGIQSIYLRANDDLTSYIKVSLENNHLIISEKSNGVSNELIDFDLYELTPASKRISLEEDSKNALVSELYMRGRFSSSASDSLVFYNASNEAKSEEALSVKDGGEEYIPSIEINELGNTDLKISLKDSIINVTVDGENITNDVEVSIIEEGNIVLGASYGGAGYSQRNVADDVYDGVFKDLIIKDSETNTELFDNSLHGFEIIFNTLKNTWNTIINWFIVNL